MRILLQGLLLLTLTACWRDERARTTPELPVTGPPLSALELRIAHAKPGAVIEVPAGRFAMSRSLRIRARGVYLHGAGKGMTVLDFSRAVPGPDALEILAAGVTVADLAVYNPQANGVAVIEAKDIAVRGVRVEWPTRRKSSVGIRALGALGLVVSRSDAVNATDAAVLIQQSQQVAVRECRATFSNVGIQIANSTVIDVSSNLVAHNSIGVLVMNLPSLPRFVTTPVRLFHNSIVDNTAKNLARADGVVASLPGGSGVVILANDRTEVFDNDVSGQPSAGVFVASYLFTNLAYQDPGYDAYAESVHIHHNRFARNGFAPQNEHLASVKALLGPGELSDIMRDGFSDNMKLVHGRLPDELRLCMHDNSAITNTNNNANTTSDKARFVDLDAVEDYSRPSIDARTYTCELPALPATFLPLH